MIHSLGNGVENQRSKIKRKKNFVIKFLNITQVNIIYTFLLLFIFTYLFLVGLLDRDFYDPLNRINDETKNVSMIDKDSSISKVSYSDGILLLFFTLSIGIIFGYFLQLIYLPSLIGHLILGVIVRNIQFLKNNFILSPTWSSSIRLMAFVIIMVRCGTGLNIKALKKYWLLSGALGIISTSFEGISIALTAYFVSHFPPLYGILFGFLLAATSPAVIVPSMIELEEKKLGTKKGLPTIILVGASIDNIFSISIIYLFITMIFNLSAEVNVLRSIIFTILQVIGGIIFGLIVAILFFYVPKTTFDLFHTIRTSILVIISFALFFTFRHYSLHISGPISILSMTIFLSLKWKEDNEDKMTIESKSLTHIWKLFFEPLLFIFIGYEMELSRISISTILISLIFIGIGIIGRIFSVFFITLSSHLSILEGIYACFAFIPKATVQAALVPFVYEASLLSSNEEIKSNANIVISTCILSILVTAPIGRLFLLCFSRLCLVDESTEDTDSENIESRRKAIISNPALGHWPNHVNYPIPSYYTNVYFPNY